MHWLRGHMEQEILQSQPGASPKSPGIILALKISIGATSVLSIIGGALIVLTFCLRLCSRSDQRRRNGGSADGSYTAGMMSPARVILVNLSIADILLAGSHLWGVSLGYQKYFLHNDHLNNSAPNGSTDLMCDIQGGLAVYSTIASFLWTIILSFFVVGTLILPSPRRYGSLCAVLVYLVVCWGFPAVVLVVVAVKKELGFDDYVDVAWCYTLPASKRQTLFINLFAYNLWSYLSILLLVVFFMVTLCYTCRVPRAGRMSINAVETAPLLNSTSHQGATQPEMKSDYFKLIFAALILVVLRIWDAIYVSVGYSPTNQIEESKWVLALIFLAGIGNSAQGAANAVLFLLFTKTYRSWVVQTFSRCCRYRANNELTHN